MITHRDLDNRTCAWLVDYIDHAAGPPELVRLAQLKLEALSLEEEGELLITTRDEGKASLAWQNARRALRSVGWLYEDGQYRRVEVQQPVRTKTR